MRFSYVFYAVFEQTSHFVQVSILLIFDMRILCYRYGSKLVAEGDLDGGRMMSVMN